MFARTRNSGSPAPCRPDYEPTATSLTVPGAANHSKTATWLFGNLELAGLKTSITMSSVGKACSSDCFSESGTCPRFRIYLFTLTHHRQIERVEKETQDNIQLTLYSVLLSERAFTAVTKTPEFWFLRLQESQNRMPYVCILRRQPQETETFC